MAETLEVRQFWLGLSPYTLIELRDASDGSGEPALHVDAGGGAEDDPQAMPMLLLTGFGAAGNPLAAILRQVWTERPFARPGVEAVVRELNPDWLPFVTEPA